MPSTLELSPWRFLALAAGLVWPVAGWGAEPSCAVRVSPGAPGAWEAAARGVAGRVGSRPQDCREISLVVHADASATLRFSTRDGRVAERSLATPEELGPLVEALLVATLPPSPPDPPPAPRPSVTVPANDPARSPATPELLGAFAAGGRMTGSGSKVARYFSPVIDVGIRGLLGSWELGALGEWVPLYHDVGRSNVTGFSMSSLLLGVQVGRRLSVWRGALRYGASLGILQVHAEADATGGGDAPMIDRAQTRAGIHVGAVLPESTIARFLVDLQGDLVLAGTGGRNTPLERTLPPLPGFGVVLTLGVEGRVL